MIPGWNSDYGAFRTAGQNLLDANSNDIVLTLNWTEVAGSGANRVGDIFDGGVYLAGSWIGVVAEKIAQHLVDWGIDAQSLNLVGYSLGTLLSSEIAWRLKNTHNLGDVATVTALDPPSEAGFAPPAPTRGTPPPLASQTELRYLNGFEYRRSDESDPVTDPVDFNSVSQFSRAFVGRTSIAGNREFAIEADEAFLVDFGSEAAFKPEDQHGSVFRVFNSLISSETHITRNLLAAKDYQQHTEFQEDGISSDFEGVLLAETTNEGVFAPALGFYAKKANGDGFVVYGRDIDDRITLVESPSGGFPSISIMNGKTLDASVISSGNTYYLGAGNDEITLSTTSDDIIYGDFPEEWREEGWEPPANSTFNDTIDGGGGDDTIHGGEGNDVLNGGDGEDTVFFTGNFENYDFQGTDIAIFVTHARGSQIDGKDALSGFEFAQFADRKVPLPLRDGPAQTVSTPILDAEQEVGSVSLTLPTYMYDRDVDYTLNISANAATGLYYIAYIIDTSGSMDGEYLETAKNAYIALTQGLIDSNLTANITFSVISFNSLATRVDFPSDPQAVILYLDSLSADGGTQFDPALYTANQFFTDAPTEATKIAYFLSDGFASGFFDSTAQALQSKADVQAFGIGNGASLIQLNIVDSDDAVILSNPSDLEAALTASSKFSRDDISRIEIYLDDVVVSTILPAQLQENALGFSFSGSIQGLDIALDAQNNISAKVIFTDGREPVVEAIVTAGGSAVSGTEQDDQLNLGGVDPGANAGGGNDTVHGNYLNNTLEGGTGDDSLFGAAGDDFLLPGLGKDQIDGGKGIDTVVYNFTLAQAGEIKKTGANITVAGQSSNGDSPDLLTSVEYIQFADTRISAQSLTRVPILSVSEPTFVAVNGIKTARLTVSLSSVADADVHFNYKTIAGTATAGNDFTSIISTITIPIGQTSATIDIALADDTVAEADEKFHLEISGLAGATSQSNQTQLTRSIVIENDIAPAQLNLAENLAIIAEGESRTQLVTFKVTRSVNTNGATTVNYALFGYGENPVEASDFQGTVFPAAQLHLLQQRLRS